MSSAKQELSKRFEFTVRFLETVKVTDKEERYTDAKTPGLTLAVKPSKRKKEGSKLWRFRYMVDGKAQMISLGAYPTVSLKDARDKAHDVRKMLDKGLDPSEERQLEKHTPSERSFQAIAELWFADKVEHTWEKTYGSQNCSRFIRYIYPALGSKDINTVTLVDFDTAVQPMLKKGALVVAARTLRMCVNVLSYAARFRFLEDKGIILDLREYINQDLPRAQKRRLPAITDPEQVGAVMHRISMANELLANEKSPVVIAALQIIPYVFVRPSELLHARWEEINFQKAEWYISGARMKTGHDHVVPLSKQVLTLLDALKPLTGDGPLLFPSPVLHIRPFTLRTLLEAVKSIAGDTAQTTTHGFRATASTFLNGNKNHELPGFAMPYYDRDLIEMQLAHTEKDKVRESYNRRDPYSRIEERREMMQTYANLLDYLRDRHRTKLAG